MSSATDFAVNANHATTASSPKPVPIAIVMRLGPRLSTAFVAAPGLKEIGVIATSVARLRSRTPRSRSGGAVSPAVTIHSTRNASLPPAMRHSSRARSNAMTSPSCSSRVPLRGSPPIRRLRAPRPAWTKKASLKRPICMLPATPSSLTSASAEAPSVTGRSAAPNSCRRPRSSIVTSEVRPLSAAACVTRPSCLLDGFDADYVDRRQVPAGPYRECVAHVAIAVAASNHGVGARPQLEVLGGERPERSDAIHRDARQLIGLESDGNGLRSELDELAEPFDLRREARPLLRFGAGRPEQRARVREHGVAEEQRRVVDEIRQLRVEARSRLRSFEPRLREQQRAIAGEHRIVQLDRLAPELAPLERERARLGQRDLIELRGFLGLHEPVGGFG